MLVIFFIRTWFLHNHAWLSFGSGFGFSGEFEPDPDSSPDPKPCPTNDRFYRDTAKYQQRVDQPMMTVTTSVADTDPVLSTFGSGLLKNADTDPATSNRGK